MTFSDKPTPPRPAAIWQLKRSAVEEADATGKRSGAVEPRRGRRMLQANGFERYQDKHC